MKRVLVLIHTPTFGGPHNQVLSLNKALLRMEIEQIVVLPKESQDSYKRLKDGGVNVTRQKIRRLRRPSLIANNIGYFIFFWKDVLLIKRLIKTYKIDLVQICGLMHIHGAIAANISRKKIVWQLLSSTFVPRPLRDLYCFFVKILADSVMVVGQNTLLQHPFHKSFRSVVNFFPPVDETLFKRDLVLRETIRKLLKISNNEVVIGTVGNHVKPKAHQRIIDLVDPLLEKNSNLQFVIAGKYDQSHSDYYSREVFSRYKKLKFQEKLTFTDDFEVYEILQAFDVFLLSSETEGLPTVVLEAICCGLPIISTNVGSIREAVNSENGIIVPNYDHKQMMAAIEKLTNNEKKRGLLAEGSMKMKKIFYLENCILKHCEAYGNS